MHEWKKGITAKGIGIEQVFYLFRIDLYVNKRREGGSFACGIKNGNKVFFGHTEDSATFVTTTSCYFLFFFLDTAHGNVQSLP